MYKFEVFSGGAPAIVAVTPQTGSRVLIKLHDDSQIESLRALLGRIERGGAERAQAEIRSALGIRED